MHLWETSLLTVTSGECSLSGPVVEDRAVFGLDFNVGLTSSVFFVLCFHVPVHILRQECVLV